MVRAMKTGRAAHSARSGVAACECRTAAIGSVIARSRGCSRSGCTRRTYMMHRTRSPSCRELTAAASVLVVERAARARLSERLAKPGYVIDAHQRSRVRGPSRTSSPRSLAPSTPARAGPHDGRLRRVVVSTRARGAALDGRREEHCRRDRELRTTCVQRRSRRPTQ